MPFGSTANNNLAATFLVVVAATETLWGCASSDPRDYRGQVLSGPQCLGKDARIFAHWNPVTDSRCV